MSWIVERLIMETSDIKSAQSIDSDAYDDLLFLEKKVNDLYSRGYISGLEMKVLILTADGLSVQDISKELNLSRPTVYNIFRNACNRISFYLGGYYTDSGFLQALQDKYNLTEIEINRIKSRMNSRLRHQ